MARRRLAFLSVATALLVCAAGAEAATVEVKKVYDKAAYTGDRILLRAAPGEANGVTVAQETLNTVTVADRVPLQPGVGCEAVSALLARCTTEHTTVSLYASLADGDDVLRAVDMDAGFAKLLGGPGDDHLVGPASSLQTLFDGGPGDDRMEGGPGGDLFREGAKRNGSDTLAGGSNADRAALLPEFDTVDYGDRRRSLRVYLDDLPNDGEAGEHDRIGTDVERVVAGAGADRMVGDDRGNELVGGPGRDVLRGGAGNDHLVGDEFPARPKRQEDLILGGPGDDRIEGGLGVDRISGGPGHDSIATGASDDRVNARDDALDAVLCGGGRDWIYHDSADFLNAECGDQGGAIPAHVVPLFWADAGDRLSLALGCPLHHGVPCTADVTLAVAGQSFGPRSFKLDPGRYAWLWLPLGSRTTDNPDPSLDGGVLTFRSTDSPGHVATESVPLSEVHRDPTPFSFFLPPVLPFL